MTFRNKVMNKATAHGFTLLELIVVLSVLAILLSWGMPSLTQSIRNNSVLAQTNELIAMLHFTKSEALRRNSDVRVVLDADVGSWEAFVDDPADAEDVDSCLPGQLRCASFTGANLTADVTEIRYNNRGYIRSDGEDWAPETLYVQHSECQGNSQRRRIDITATGQIRSCTLACNDLESEC